MADSLRIQSVLVQTGMQERLKLGQQEREAPGQEVEEMNAGAQNKAMPAVESIKGWMGAVWGLRGAEEMAQLLNSTDCLLQVLGLIPRTHVMADDYL